MNVSITFFSYFRDLAGCVQTTETFPNGSTLADLLVQVSRRFPKLAPMQNSALTAVGLDYQPRSYVLQAGDEVALFPPVQGG